VLGERVDEEGLSFDARDAVESSIPPQQREQGSTAGSGGRVSSLDANKAVRPGREIW